MLEMAKEKKARYIVELDLILETFQFHILEKRLEIARKISNACKRKMLDHLQLLRQNQEYQYWLKQPKSEERSNQLTELREQYDVSKTGAERIVKDMGKHYKKKKPKNPKNKQRVHLDSLVVQKIALAVWDSVSDYLFNSKTKKVHFKKFGQFDTIEGKNNKSGLTYENGILYWNGLELKVHFPKKDQYLAKAMHDEIAYCRLIRKTIRGKVKYYLQLVMKGIPTSKERSVMEKLD